MLSRCRGARSTIGSCRAIDEHQSLAAAARLAHRTRTRMPALGARRAPPPERSERGRGSDLHFCMSPTEQSRSHRPGSTPSVTAAVVSLQPSRRHIRKLTREPARSDKGISLSAPGARPARISTLQHLAIAFVSCRHGAHECNGDRRQATRDKARPDERFAPRAIMPHRLADDHIRIPWPERCAIAMAT